VTIWQGGSPWTPPPILTCALDLCKDMSLRSRTCAQKRSDALVQFIYIN